MRKFLIPMCLTWVACLGCVAWFIAGRRNAEVKPACATCASESRKGLTINPGEGFPKIPGNPETAVKSFKHLYQAMVTYRAIHGRFPSGTELRDVTKPIAPGVQLTASDMAHADAQTPEYAASQPGAKSSYYLVSYRRPRPNGQPKPVFPRSGEKDLWFTSKHYMRCLAIGKGSSASLKNYGVFVGLFSDGDIQVRSMDQLVARRLGSNDMEIDFPDETGLPKDTVPVNVALEQIVNYQRGTVKPTVK